MLAALLCNLEEPRGPILREKGSASLRDVERAGKRIEEILFPSLVPAKTKIKVKRAIEKVYEYNALPTVDMPTLNGAVKETQAAIDDVKALLADLGDPQWMVELRVLLQNLTLIAWQLNDDEEALLLLM